MIDDENFTKAAKADFTMRIVIGFLFGSIAAIAAFIFLIVCIVNGPAELILPMVFLAVAGLVTAGSCGYFLFRKGNKKK